MISPGRAPRNRSAAVRRRLLLIDLAVGLLLAIVVLIIAPGLAIVAIIAIVALIACGITFAIGARRGRSRGPRTAPRRPPPGPRDKQTNRDGHAERDGGGRPPPPRRPR